MNATATAAASNDNAQSITINGYLLSARWADEQERIRDIELAVKLRYKRPAKIRDLIAKLIRDGKLSDVRQIPTVGIRADGRPSKPANEYWLTELQALIVIRHCETEVADAIMTEVYEVFIAWRHGRLATGSDPKLVAEVQTLRALVETQQRAFDECIAGLRQQLMALTAGTISPAMWRHMRQSVRQIVDGEMRVRRHASRPEAYASIYRELHERIRWGGKKQPWSTLPARDVPLMFVVLHQRKAVTDRQLEVLANDRQLHLPYGAAIKNGLRVLS